MKKAFTLIELLLVIIIMGILLNLTLPVLRGNFAQLQLESFSSRLLSLMNYLQQRSVVEGRIIFINLDPNNQRYWVQRKGEDKISTFGIPLDLTITAQENKVAFYPDGSMDKVTVTINNRLGKSIGITSKGVFGGVKLLAQ
jgi:prepilin-type N-terminal cleavage/methylation domain-containing protein